MNTNTLGKLVSGTLCVLAVACGSDDESGKDAPTSVRSGVPPERAVNSLTEAEAKQVSASFAQALEASGLAGAMCTFNGLMGEQFAAAFGETTTCEQIEAECKAAPMQTNSTLTVKDDPSTLAACTVTVGELEVCMNDTLAQFKQSLGGITCNSDLEAVTQSLTAAPASAACEKVNSTCPTLLATGDQAETPAP